MMSMISSGDVGLMYKESVLLSGKNILKFFWGGSILASKFGPIVTKNSLNLLLISSGSFINLPLCLNESEVDKCCFFLFITFIYGTHSKKRGR